MHSRGPRPFHRIDVHARNHTSPREKGAIATCAAIASARVFSLDALDTIAYPRSRIYSILYR
ncbi:hypothetical protein DVU_0537 [Nitratidesulfovibrio vulgaris str. Hildenborough]|uniref:Uncharacterized protein n=1 Tax=Nitratidesulfovibrio vulgaris (strain ATCC 29579 / DSM 644 / CCUG 34227 / NCIMB 8303 / VKM B-1760 / Hildenborough) TaxID=882 RepID=Q72EP0_NITV2|nr:hypothetical protein DVU_0537 [Nitratidesulfovibrio vulgaris str. Hildenborough]